MLYIEVKLFMFQSYCSNVYGSHMWYNFRKVQINKLRVTSRDEKRGELCRKDDMKVEVRRKRGRDVRT